MIQLDIPKNSVAIILDDEDIVRGVVQRKEDNPRNILSLEECLEDVYASPVRIQSILYHSYTETYTMVAHVWENPEGGPPDIHDFTLQISKIY